MDIFCGIIVGIISATAGSFFGAYFSKKGEYLATKEDLKDILVQVKRTTELTEEIKSDFKISQTTYEQYLREILEYYKSIYKYYKLCQKIASGSHIGYPDGTMKFAPDLFFEQLDETVNACYEKEGYLRIILPDNIRKLNEELIIEFNEFTQNLKIKKEETNYQAAMMKQDFEKIQNKKDKLEEALRKYVRTENLIKDYETRENIP